MAHLAGWGVALVLALLLVVRYVYYRRHRRGVSLPSGRRRAGAAPAEVPPPSPVAGLAYPAGPADPQRGLQEAMQRIVDDQDGHLKVSYPDGKAVVRVLKNAMADIVVDDEGSPQAAAVWNYDPYARRQGVGGRRWQSHPMTPQEVEARIAEFKQYGVCPPPALDATTTPPP